MLEIKFTLVCKVRGLYEIPLHGEDLRKGTLRTLRAWPDIKAEQSFIRKRRLAEER